jgi:flagellar biosynthesis GTPase FlhF
MEKLKKQDEERKKRKKEEKAKKEQEREIKKRLDEEKLAREAEEKELLAEVERKKKKEEERIKREKEENERRKDNFERSIKKIWNGSDIPCLFESKIAYSKLLYSLPADLEDRILKNEVPNEDLVFRRYKVLLIPLDSLLSRTSGLQLIEIINYFLRYSTMKKVQNNEEGEAKLKTFPFKCIGVVQSVAVPPFNKCSLSAVSP